MSDVPENENQATGSPTARVADSYGVNPHEHKPSQDPWDPETADEKQAGTGGVNPSVNGLTDDADEVREEEPSPGTSSSPKQRNARSSSAKSQSSND